MDFNVSNRAWLISFTSIELSWTSAIHACRISIYILTTEIATESQNTCVIVVYKHSSLPHLLSKSPVLNPT